MCLISSIRRACRTAAKRARRTILLMVQNPEGKHTQGDTHTGTHSHIQGHTHTDRNTHTDTGTHTCIHTRPADNVTWPTGAAMAGSTLCLSVCVRVYCHGLPLNPLRSCRHRGLLHTCICPLARTGNCFIHIGIPFAQLLLLLLPLLLTACCLLCAGMPWQTAEECQKCIVCVRMYVCECVCVLVWPAIVFKEVPEPCAKCQVQMPKFFK